MRSSCSVQQAIFFRYRSVGHTIVPVAKVRGYADLRPEMSQSGFLRHDAQADSGVVRVLLVLFVFVAHRLMDAWLSG